MDFVRLFQGLKQIRDSFFGMGGFVKVDTTASDTGTLSYDTPSAGFILYDNLAGGPYTVGETVTGGTSAATGVVVEDTGSRLVMDTIVGTFVNNETLTGGTSGATSDADGAVTFYDFEEGEEISGATSGATATIFSIESGELLLIDIVGTFQNNEKINGGTSGAEYLADGVVAFASIGNYYILKADGAADAVLERIVQQNGVTIEGVTILKGTELRGSFVEVRVTSGIVYAYEKNF